MSLLNEPTGPFSYSIGNSATESLVHSWVGPYQDRYKQDLTAHLPTGSPVDYMRLYNMIAAISFPDQVEIKPTKLTTEGQRYIYISALQKAIRFNDYKAAVYAAKSLATSGFDVHLWRRLPVIMVEDIGIGDPYLCGLTLWAAKQPSIRLDRDFLYRLIKYACSAYKSRAIVDMAVATGLPKVFDAVKTVSAHISDDEERVAIWVNPYSSIQDKLIVALPTYGKAFQASFHHDDLGAGGGARADAFWTNVGKNQGWPPLLFSLVRLTFSVMKSDFAVAWPIAWALAASGPIYSESSSESYWPGMEFPKTNSGLYLATFDKHTNLGKQAVAYVKKSKPNWFADPSGRTVSDSEFERLVFYTEGSHLDPILRSLSLDSLYSAILHLKWSTEGWESSDLARQHYLAVMSDLGPLHHARKRIGGYA